MKKSKEKKLITNKKVLVVSGPSGVGKTTLCDELLKKERRIKPCITATTRKPRPKEINGKDYHFITKKTFVSWLKTNKIIEYARLFGEFYGTPKKSIEAVFKNGHYPLLRIDVEGARNIKKLGYNGVFVFILPPNLKELKNRLKKRRTSTADMQKRLTKAKKELKHKSEYSFHVVNNNLKKAVKDLKNILTANLFN